MWTVQNVSADIVSITDTPILLTWNPGALQSVPMAYFQQSRQLSQAIASQQLCVIAYGSFAPIASWAPLTYVVAGTLTNTGLQPVTLTQSLNTAPLTLGPFTQGTVLLNVTAFGASGDSVALGFQAWDGVVFYPVQSVIAATTTMGPLSAAWNPPALAGRFVWTVSGSATVSLLYHVLAE